MTSLNMYFMWSTRVSDFEGFLDDKGGFFLMNLANADRRLAELRAAWIFQIHSDQILKPRLNKRPSSHVAMFLLAPDEFWKCVIKIMLSRVAWLLTFCVRIFIDFLLQLLCGKGTKLLDSDQSHIRNFLLLCKLFQGVIMLSTHEHNLQNKTH